MSVAEPPSSPLIETDAGEAAGGRPDTTAEPEVVVQEVDRLATPDPVEGGGEVDGKTALSTGSRSPEEALEKEKEKEVDDDPIVVDGPPPVLIKCRIPGCDATVMSGIAEASHMRQDHPDEYKIYYPKPRGRPLKRRRHLHLFMSQINKLYPPAALPGPGIYSDPCFYVPGRAVTKHSIDVSNMSEFFNGSKYTCPVGGCSKVYKTQSGLSYHMLRATCEPEMEIAEQLERQWEEEDMDTPGNDGGSWDPSVPMKLKDAPYFTAYKWPQGPDGIWCLTQMQIDFFIAGPDGKASNADKNHCELDFRWSSREERKMLFSLGIIASDMSGTEFQVFKAFEVHELIKHNYPGLHHRLVQFRTMINDTMDIASLIHADKMQIEETPFTVGDVDAAKKAQTRATKLAAQYNNTIAFERREELTEFYEICTGIMHRPAAKMLRVTLDRRVGRYPVSALPGQFQDGFNRYKSLAEVRRYINPTSAVDPSAAAGKKEIDIPKIKPLTQKELVQAKIQARKRGQVTQTAMRHIRADEVCAICDHDCKTNKKGVEEQLVACAACPTASHPSCVQIPPEIVPTIRTYQWQCLECKVCSKCSDPNDEDKMLFCDACDRGYHTFCVGLKSPPKGRWTCELCSVCASCGTDSSGGKKWRHEYTKGNGSGNGAVVFLQTLCIPCSNRFRKGEFCPSCLVVYHSDDDDLPMVCCDTCERWIHAECDNLDEDAYEALTDDDGGQQYKCMLCRGEQEERHDAFHAKYGASRSPRKRDKHDAGK